MIVELGYAVERMPTNGIGGSVAALGTGSTVITTVAEKTVTLAGTLTGIDVGTIILTSGGHWAVATGLPTGQVVPINGWNKRGVKSNYRNDGSRQGGLPVNTETYRAFVGAAVMGREGGWKIRAYNLGVAVAGTLTLQGPTGALAYTLPVNIAGFVNAWFDDGPVFDGPFTITPSLATILGHIEFFEASR